MGGISSGQAAQRRMGVKSPSTHHYDMRILALLAALLRLKVRRQEQLALKLEGK